MQKLLILSILLMSMNKAFCQDLIVTAQGDSLKCKITAEANDFVFFDIRNTKGQTINTSISKQQTLDVDPDYYTNQPKPVRNTNYKKGHLGFDLGWGYKLGKTIKSGNSDLDNLVKGARSGFTFGLDGALFFSANWGLGLRYNFFSASNKEKNNDIKFRTNYIGPSFYSRVPLQNSPKSFFISSVGLGYMGEKQSGTYNSQKITIKGKTLGMMFSLGFDIKFVSIELACLAGSLNKWEQTLNGRTTTINAPKDQNESLSRLELKIGLKI